MIIVKAIGNIFTTAATTIDNTAKAADEAAKYAKEMIQVERLKMLAEASKELKSADLQAVKQLQDVLKKLD